MPYPAHGCIPQDEPEHYDPPGGLLFFDLRVDHLIDAASAINFTGKLDDLKGHFDLVNAQLTQVNDSTGAKLQHANSWEVLKTFFACRSAMAWPLQPH